MTAWSGRRVIGMVQRPWGGCLDGMNEDGLVASCTLGGIARRGEGFAIIQMLRYVLETCGSVREGVAALSRLPAVQLHNVTLLDRSGDHATVFLGPRREPAVTRQRTCTNHQERVSSASRSALRQRVLEEALDDPATTLAALAARFAEPPLHSRKLSFPRPIPPCTGPTPAASTTSGPATAGAWASTGSRRGPIPTITGCWSRGERGGRYASTNPVIPGRESEPGIQNRGWS